MVEGDEEFRLRGCLVEKVDVLSRGGEGGRSAYTIMIIIESNRE